MTISNYLSILRILLIPIIIALIFIIIPNHYYYALVLYLFAMATDFLDGYIARKYKLESKLGRFLDPLADKMLNILMMVTLVYLKVFPLWIVLLHIARDLIVDAIINLQASLKIFTSAVIGPKLRTLFLLIAVAGGIIYLINNQQILLNTVYILLIISLLVSFIGIKKQVINISKQILKKWKR